MSDELSYGKAFGRSGKEKRDNRRSFIMRITNQMLARTSAKSGVPLPQNSLLDIMNKRSSFSNNTMSPLGNTGKANQYLQKINEKSKKELKSSAESLSGYAKKLSDDGADSLFAKAEETGDTSELVENIIGMTEAYNKTMKHLSGSDGTLDRFYLQELESYLTEHADALKAVGITTDRSGKISVQKDTLKSAGLDALKAAFGREAGFTEKAAYVSGRAAQNASAATASLLGGYDSSGKAFWNSFTKNMYNFWG